MALGQNGKSELYRRAFGRVSKKKSFFYLPKKSGGLGFEGGGGFVRFPFSLKSFGGGGRIFFKRRRRMKTDFSESRGDYIDGAFVPAQSRNKKEYRVFSPADKEERVFRFFSDPAHIEPALSSAVKAYPSWSGLSQEKRNHYLQKLARVFKSAEEEIALSISRETGKPLWESRGEAKALSQKVDTTLKEALPLVQDKTLSPLSPGRKEKIAYRSRGVFLVLGPFNFPVHLPNGHIVPALATGNTVVFKASEKTPMSAEKLSACFDRAGFPKGVFNLIQGGADTARALVDSPKIDGILFTGSYSVGREIKERVRDQPRKILALEMGGKNSCLIWKDADWEKAVYEVLKGAYLSCGQRCSATSRLILHEEIKKPFLKKLIDLSRRITIGHYRENPFMGPLIDAKAVKRFLSAFQEAEKEKALVHLSAQSRTLSQKGFYVCPAIVEPLKYSARAFYQREELFAPLLAVYSVREEEEAFDLINKGDYGLCLSLFTRQEDLARRAFQKARVGVFHWNLSSNGASSRLPFGGLCRSGNDRPAGLFAVHNCTTPVACLQKEDLDEEDSFWKKNFFISSRDKKAPSPP